MPAPTFYLETSIWGTLAPRQSRDRKQVVHRLLKLLDGVRGECVVSDVVVTEIEEASSDKAEQILEYLDRAQPRSTQSMRRLKNLLSPTLPRVCCRKAVMPMRCTSRRQRVFKSIFLSVGTIGIGRGSRNGYNMNR